MSYEMSPDFYAPDRSAEDIERENTFHDPAPGDYTLIVLSYEVLDPIQVKVRVDGMLDMYESMPIRVRFGVDGDTSCTINDKFVLPPGNARQRNSYLFGKVVHGDKESPKGGFDSSKMFHFMAALGFDWVQGKPLPRESLSLDNWVNRKVQATIQAGKPWQNDKGETVDGRVQVKLFTYRRPGTVLASPMSATAPVSRPAAHQSPARPVAPVSASLDNL